MRCRPLEDLEDIVATNSSLVRRWAAIVTLPGERASMVIARGFSVTLQAVTCRVGDEVPLAAGDR